MAVIGRHWARGKGRTDNRIRVTGYAGDQNRDEDADARRNLLRSQPKSVLSGRTLDEVS